MTDKCIYCESTTKELRPYGPNGAWVCLPCAMATPDRLKQTEVSFYSQMDAALVQSPTGEVVIGEVTGPRPMGTEELQLLIDDETKIVRRIL